ncbi:hypothetical protein [Hymenobacter baengnokdamensis]|uniref:hypothetical protein n=1 Tax=Hymenobacter baengnokdamensis TaxID=2615203 RepID=UPI001248171A|nr:hypothetical protein [Hymenobacter baengnokdamensis]
MTEDEQSGTLAFLQNFYTGVTLYVPRETHERAASQAPAPAQPAATSLPAAATPAVAKQVTPAIAATPPASKLPSLATAPAPAPPRQPTPPAAASAPAADRPGPLPIAAAPVAPYLLTTFSTLGSNAQGVVVLVRLPAEQFVKLPRNVFLNKLLQAIQLVMADVVLVNVEGVYPVALENLRKEIAATHVLAFGKNLLDIAVRTTQIYEPVQFPAVGLSYLAGAEIEMIEYDISLKKRLWGGLQRMFLN